MHQPHPAPVAVERPRVDAPAPTGDDRLRNAMTVDVEDYFHVQAFANTIRREDWDSLPCRVERNTNEVMDLFAANGTKATFFTLGWVAQRYPQLIRRIVDDGHELASHGMAHFRADEQTPEVFRDDVSRAKALLEQTGGTAVTGYRAASFSIGTKNLWALDVLGEAGYAYSSSIYPIQHDHYGMPDAPRFPFRPLPGKPLREFPVTTVNIAGRNFPSGGGGYFRLLPYALSRFAIGRVNRHDRRPSTFYFHPWEIDPDQPRQTGAPLRSRFRHYTNLGVMRAKLERVLADFAWDRMDRVLDQQLPA